MSDSPGRIGVRNGIGRLVGALALALTAVTAPHAAAQGLVDNVNGMTLDEDGRVVRFGAMVVGDDGRVVALLRRGERPPRELRWRADMEGRTLLPGMVDGHGHVMGLGFQLRTLDLSETDSLEEAIALIRQGTDENTATWIVGRGWNQERWGLGRFPTAADLDAAFPGKAIYLERVDGHAAWANSKAMELAGITAETEAPAGGRIETNDDGTPSGIFVDAAQALFDDALPQPTPRERNAAFLAAQDALIADGITATADMGTSVDDWLLYRRMGDVGLLRMRIMSYAAGIDTALRVAGQGPTEWLYRDRLRMGGVKLYADGALGSRGAWLKADYADAPGERGLRFLSDDQLLNLMTRGAMDRFQIAVHAIGDAANQQAVDAVEELSDTFGDDRRWRIEHAQIVDPADFAKFGRHGIIASMQPVHQTSDMHMAEARLGEARLVGAYAWRSMLEAGAVLAFGSDYPVESPDPFAGWAVGFTRQDADLQPFGGWRPEEAVTREQAWAGFTTGAAYAGYAEDRFGRLAPGLWADFIIVDRDPLLASPTQLRGTEVLETWIAGERVYQRDAAE
ncbi:amidohydrolase [Sphingosinithalassobacter sp. CS137]|uniref:amidohydrolase n=1 Tax=Sphingosinithalassobacter sp. CS137 TaxID=2762748 RepID=UPI00165E98E3